MERKTALTRRSIACLAAALLSHASPLAAQPVESDAPSEERESPDMKEAKERYLRGVQLVDEGAYDAALLEFKKANALVPNYKLYYNMAVLSQRLNDFAEAYRLYERYLRDGGAEITEQRRAYVDGQLRYLAGRVARLRIVVDAAHAQITLDDVVVGQSPLGESLLVNAGRRKISASATGRLPATRSVEVAGGDALVVELQLPKPQREPSPIRDRATKPPRESERIATWPFWVATAGVAGIAGAYTIKAFSSKQTLDEQRDRFGVTRGELDQAEQAARRDALIADVLWGTTAAVGGVALVVTLWGGESAKQVGIGPHGVRLEGRF